MKTNGITLERNKAAGIERPAERGIALIVTLVILAMLTILLVAFVSNMRVESKSTHAFTNQMKARFAAEAAVEQAISQIAIGCPTNGWFITVVSNAVNGAITNPITYFVTNGFTLPGLTTNFSNPSVALLDSNDFNAQGFIYPKTLVAQFPVPWVYLANSFAPAGSVSNLGLTRLAWWIDDESSKINVNYAGNTNGIAGDHVRSNVFDVSSINLAGITNGITGTANILGNRTPPYETLSTLMEVPGLTYTNLFVQGMGIFSTVGSADYELQTNRALRVNINDLVTNSASSYAAVSNLYNAITNAYSGYKGKYGAGPTGDQALYQICANIHGYIDAGIPPVDEVTNDWSGTRYFGRKKVPYLNEIKFQTLVNSRALVPADVTLGKYEVIVTNLYYVELFNLYNTAFNTNTTITFDYPTVTLIGVDVLGTPYSISGGSTNFNSSALVPAFGSGPSGGIAVYTNTVSVTYLTNTPAVVLTPAPFTVSLTTMTSTNTYRLGTSNRLDYAVVSLLGNPTVPPTTHTPVGGAQTTNTTSASAIDPRFNHMPTNWVNNDESLVISSLGQRNTLGTAPPWTPATLGDSNTVAGLEGDGGFPFANTTMPTVGELGNIVVPGNYFRTLKMYGDGYTNAAGQLPDWVLLDLFTVTNPGIRVNGKMNINTQRDFLYGGSYGALQGLLQGIAITNNYFVSPTVAQTMATNMMSNIPYYQIGELGSKALALSNQSDQTTDQRREAVIRALSNVITIRGNTFSIYGMGQTVNILQGKTNVTGEAYIQSVVECSFTGPTNSLGVVTNITGRTFRTKYHRFLTE